MSQTPINVTYSLEELIKEMSSRLEKMDAKFETKFQEFESKLDKMDAKFETKLDKIDQKFSTKLYKIDEKFSTKFEKTETRLNKLEIGQTELITEVQNLKENVRDIKNVQNILVQEVSDLKGAKALIIPIIVAVVTAFLTLLVRLIPNFSV